MLDELKKNNYFIKFVKNNIVKDKYIGSRKKLAIIVNKKSSSDKFLLNLVDLSIYEEIRIFNLNKEIE